MRKGFVLLLTLAILSIGCGAAQAGAASGQIAAGYFHMVVLKSDGTVWTWGGNYYGQIGDGITTDRYTPVQVSGLVFDPGTAAAPVPALSLPVIFFLAAGMSGIMYWQGRKRRTS